MYKHSALYGITVDRASIFSTLPVDSPEEQFWMNWADYGDSPFWEEGTAFVADLQQGILSLYK